MDDVIAYIERAVRRGRWAIIIFHGIGAEWNVVDPMEFDRLVEYLSRNRDRIWIAPIVEIARFVHLHRPSAVKMGK